MKETKNGVELPIVYPIINFKIKLNVPFEITQNMNIRKLSKEEKNELLNTLNPMEITHPRRPEYCLDLKPNVNVEESGTPYQVISALRLLKPNLVGINHVIFQDVSSKVYRYPGAMEADTSTIRILKGPYVLEDEEKDIFFNLLKQINEKLTSNLDKKFRFALGRFNMSYCSKTIDDRLLNYIFALESLFLSGNSEKKFRLCCYVALALSSTSNNPKEIWHYIDSAYNARSQIVHGEGLRNNVIPVGKGPEKTKIPAKKFADKIEEYARNSILKVLDVGSVKTFQNTIQQKLLDSFTLLNEID